MPSELRSTYDRRAQRRGTNAKIIETRNVIGSRADIGVVTCHRVEGAHRLDQVIGPDAHRRCPVGIHLHDWEGVRSFVTRPERSDVTVALAPERPTRIAAMFVTRGGIFA